MRNATYVVYAFFRKADEIVDDPDGPPPEVQRERLARMRAVALGERSTDDPVMSAFRELCREYDVPDREIESFLDAMEMDVEPDGYETHDDLQSYLRGSSVAVGYMMLSLMDPDETEKVRPHARALGEAFQLTNFLRDVREDVLDYGRVYVPERSLQRHGLSRADVEDLRFSEDFAAVMRTELRRTERRYRTGVAGIRYLPDDCQLGVLLAAVLYAEHHRLIRARGYDVLSARPSLSMRRRLSLAARTWLRWQVESDPEDVFYAVSAVDRNPDDADHEDRREPTSIQRPTGHVSRLLARVRPHLWG